jgi:haloalkane dehalogenase
MISSPNPHRARVERLMASVAVAVGLLAACTSTDQTGAPPMSQPATDGSSATAGTEPAAPKPAACADAQLPPGTPLGDAELRWTSTCIPYVRTPDARFTELPDFPYTPSYVELEGGLRMAYIDEGPRDGQIVLLLHGEPSWGYLYRKMVPELTAAGLRVIAPDMVGMGRSDKPVQFDDYSYLQHVDWVTQFVDALDLTDVTAFVQDWGSLIGLRVVGDMPDRFARVVVANGRLPVLPAGIRPVTLPDPPLPDDGIRAPFADDGRPLAEVTVIPGMSQQFGQWAVYALTGTTFTASEVLQALTATELSPEELAAYDAPFPERIYMTGPRVFPSLINTVSEEPTNQAARQVFDAWNKPMLTLFGRGDQTLGSDAVQAEMRDRVPGAVGQPHHAYPDANHFIQEDEGPDLARRVVAFVEANPLP